MTKKIIINIFAGCVIMSMLVSAAFSDSKHSNDFQIKYEGNALPSDAGVSPQWERYMAGGVANEPFYCSVSDGVLTIDTVKGPSSTESAYYLLPGEWSEFVNEFYGYHDPANPWNPDLLLGYTIEVRFRMDPAIQIPENPTYPDGKFGFWLYMLEGLHGQSCTIQVFPGKIVRTGSVDEVLYSGDLTDKFHILRIVRHPGAIEEVLDVFDVYLDGVLIAEKISGSGNSAWNQDEFYVGDAAGGSGGTDIKVGIDYVRIDFTGAYEPSYLVSDVNKDLVTDLEDFALLAYNWLLYSDPDTAGFIDCTDPLNAERCQ